MTKNVNPAPSQDAQERPRIRVNPEIIKVMQLLKDLINRPQYTLKFIQVSSPETFHDIANALNVQLAALTPELNLKTAIQHWTPNGVRRPVLQLQGSSKSAFLRIARELRQAPELLTFLNNNLAALKQINAKYNDAQQVCNRQNSHQPAARMSLTNRN